MPSLVRLELCVPRSTFLHLLCHHPLEPDKFTVKSSDHKEPESRNSVDRTQSSEFSKSTALPPAAQKTAVGRVDGFPVSLERVKVGSGSRERPLLYCVTLLPSFLNWELV